MVKLSKKPEESGLIPRDTCLSDMKNLEFCTLDTFDTLTHPELKLFMQILCTDDRFKLVSKIPNRGKLKDAKDGVENAILVAYNARMNPN